jgi:hypothetical protein
VIFNKARDEKKTGGKPDSPGKGDSQLKSGVDPVKPQAVRCLITSLSLIEYIPEVANCYLFLLLHK